MRSAKVSLALVFSSLVFALPSTLLASTVSFSSHYSKGQATTQHADLNNDGCEDLAYTNGNGGFAVQLAHCDGTYAAPVSYTIPGGADTNVIAIADFNRDGKADVAAFGSDNALHLFLNSGSGTFAQSSTFAHSGLGDAYTAVVGDFNHDGAMDIAYQGGLSASVLLGNGKGGFSAGATRAVNVAGYLLLGDFNGDGRADLAIGDLTNYNVVEVLYGDGTGHFPASSLIHASGGHYIFSTADVNSDGISDIIGTQFYPSAHVVSLYYGTMARTFRYGTVALAHCAGQSATAMDVNGDGINDLVVGEADCNNNSQQGNVYIGVLSRNSNGSYNAEQIVHTSPSYLDNISAIRASRDTKADISFLNCTAAPCAVVANEQSAVLLNATAGNFAGCTPPSAFEGINVCSPLSGGSVGSPVSFAVGAAGQVPMRDVEVWVDGKKLAEQIRGFSNYTFLNRSVSLAAGTHAVTIIAVGWDDSLERKSFSLTVK
jgi:hypothetical protein